MKKKKSVAPAIAVWVLQGGGKCLRLGALPKWPVARVFLLGNEK